MKKLYFLLALTLLNMFSFANPGFYGGAITWECLSNGRYRVIMRVYQDCYCCDNGGASVFLGTYNTIKFNGGGDSLISVKLSTGYPLDITPQCNASVSLPHLNCTGMSPVLANSGAMKEYLYTTDETYPTGVLISGVPPASGWSFSWESCCRRDVMNIANASSQSWALKSTMYPYNNQNVNPCFDHSPAFAETPVTVLCQGYPYQFHQSVSDNEWDSLSFDWVPVLGMNLQPITSYNYGYSFNTPLPGVMHNPNNVTGTVHPKTGVINFTPYTSGNFTCGLRVTAYKCGIKVAEILRELHFIIKSCTSNTPPDIPSPFSNSSPYYPAYIDTVIAGKFVSFPISATDFNFHPNNMPQSVTLNASGKQFGTGFTSTTNGCMSPPCATLNPTLPKTSPFVVQTSFNWQTECSHINANIGCGVTTNRFDFVFTATDDFCPVPAKRTVTIIIVVVPKPPLPPPRMQCTRVKGNGDAELLWEAVIDTNQAFEAYHIYFSKNPNGPFSLIDSVSNLSAPYYLHSGAQANVSPNYYYIRTKYRCAYLPELSLPSDTIQTLKLNATVVPSVSVVQLSWNAIKPIPQGAYFIRRAVNNAPPWMPLAVIQGLSYTDTAKNCLSQYSYKIEYQEIPGSGTSAFYISDSVQVSINDLIKPDYVTIDTLSVIPGTQNVLLSWQAPQDADAVAAIVYRQQGMIFTALDTVWSNTQLNYTDTSGNACIDLANYSVAILDSCMNMSNMSPLVKPFSFNAEYLPNYDQIKLSWAPRVIGSETCTTYTVYRMKNYGPWSEYMTANVYPYQAFINYPDNNAVHCFFIRAKSAVSGKTETSCTECITLGNYTGLSSDEKQREFSVFPNPAQNEVIVRIPQGLGAARLQMNMIDGRLVKSAEVRPDEGLKKLDISGLSKGVYLIQLVSGKGVYTVRLVVNGSSNIE